MAPIEIEPASGDLPERVREAIAATASGRLWGIGNAALLTQPLVGMVCSSKCPGAAVSQTYDIALAIREAKLAVISGFHSPMEQEVLALLLRGSQPVAICPARSVLSMRVPRAWRTSIDAGRLLVASPFEEHHRRPTRALSEQRNQLVAAVSGVLLVPHAAPRSHTEQLCIDRLMAGQQVVMLAAGANERLVERGARELEGRNLVEFLLCHGSDPLDGAKC